jgi:hypothetical protein
MLIHFITVHIFDLYEESGRLYKMRRSPFRRGANASSSS